MENKSFTGILLAGGMGMRLRAASGNRIKALVEIEGRPLTYYAIKFLQAAGADEVLVVGAHDFSIFKDKVLEHNPDIKILEGDERGSIYSLFRIWPHIKGSFLLANADHIYRRPIAEKVKNHFSGFTAFCDFDRNLGDDDMKVMHENRKLIGISKKLLDYNAGYVGLTFCDKEDLLAYKFAMDRVIAENRGLVVEDALRRFMEEGGYVKIGDISGHGWLEVDFPEELEKAKRILAENRQDFF